MRALDSIDWKLNKPETQRSGNRTPGILDGTPSPQNEGVDRSLVEFAIQSFGSFPTSSEVVLNLAEFRATETTQSHDPEKPWNIGMAKDKLGTTKAGAECPKMCSSEDASTNRERRQFRSPSEIADMIVSELRAFDDAPKRGFTITVYGANPWNAMLTIGPDAGAVNDPQGWHSRVRDIGVRLRRDFEVVGT